MSGSYIQDASGLRTYRTEVPNLVCDLGLDPYTFRLYCHYKRVAGDVGKCWQGTRTISEATGISAGQITKSKRILEAKELIERQPGDAAKTDVVTISDIWLQNMQKYSKRSPHERGVHHMNGGCSPHERKKEPYKEEPLRSALPQGKLQGVVDTLLSIRNWDKGIDKTIEIASTALETYPHKDISQIATNLAFKMQTGAVQYKQPSKAFVNWVAGSKESQEKESRKREVEYVN